MMCSLATLSMRGLMTVLGKRFSPHLALAVLSTLGACAPLSPSPGEDASRDAGSVVDGAVQDAAVGDAALRDAGRADSGLGNDGGSEVRPCGGLAGVPCSAGEFCDFGASCSDVADAQGTCRSIPDACDALYAPVCGCDGTTYANDCSAHAAGVSIAAEGECETAAISCDRRSVLCRIVEPVCPDGQVVSIQGSCFGPCVGIEQCTCSEAAACPAPEMYTCHLSRGVCGPYVN